MALHEPVATSRSRAPAAHGSRRRRWLCASSGVSRCDRTANRRPRGSASSPRSGSRSARTSSTSGRERASYGASRTPRPASATTRAASASSFRLLVGAGSARARRFQRALRRLVVVPRRVLSPGGEPVRLIGTGQFGPATERGVRLSEARGSAGYRRRGRQDARPRVQGRATSAPQSVARRPRTFGGYRDD